jgi:hypothetical protein
MIYPNVIAVSIPEITKWSDVFQLFPRLFYLLYTFLLALVVIGYVLFYNTIIRFFSWIGSYCYE